MHTGTSGHVSFENIPAAAYVFRIVAKTDARERHVLSVELYILLVWCLHDSIDYSNIVMIKTVISANPNPYLAIIAIPTVYHNNYHWYHNATL